MPLRPADIQASKDQMRAEFAMTTRKLEMSVEDLRNKSAQSQIEIGRKEEMLDRLRTELAAQRDVGAEMASQIEQQQANMTSLERQIREQQGLLTGKDRALSDSSDHLKQARAREDEIAATADSRKVEIVALKTRIQNIEDQKGDTARKLNRREAELTALEARFKEQEKTLGVSQADAERQQRELRRTNDQISRLEQQDQRRRDEIVELKRELNALRGAAKDSAKADKKSKKAKPLNGRQGPIATSNIAGDDDPAALRENLADLAAEVAHLAARLDDTGDLDVMIDKAIEKGAGKSKSSVSSPKTLADRIRALQHQTAAQ